MRETAAGRLSVTPGATGLTGVAASVAHVCGDEAPLVRGRVVKLYGGEVAGPVVSSDHVQQPVNGTDTWGTEWRRI